MELLNDMVSTVRAEKKLERETEPIKLKRLTDSDDIESYLTTFERMMQAYKVDGSRWALKLAPELTGQALQVYASMDPSDAECYDSVKSAILRRFNINDETYRQRFRKKSKIQGRTDTNRLRSKTYGPRLQMAEGLHHRRPGKRRGRQRAANRHVQ